MTANEATQRKFAVAKELLDRTFARREDLDFEDDGHGPFMAYGIDNHSFLTALFDQEDERIYLSHHFFHDDEGPRRIADPDARSWIELRTLCGIVPPEKITDGYLKRIAECSETVYRRNSRVA